MPLLSLLSLLSLEARAEEASAKSPLDLLLAATVRDGIRIDPYTLRAQIEARCAASEPVACAMKGVDLRDRSALSEALRPLCDGGDALACLGRAWAEMPLSGSGVDPLRAAEPKRVRELVARACEGGAPRACTELGALRVLGVGSYAGRDEAELRWANACDAGEARACTLIGELISDRGYIEEGLRGGDMAALLALAERSPDQREELLQRACDAGVTGGCVSLAASAMSRPSRSLSAPRASLGSACRLGDPLACAWTIRIDASVGHISPAAAAEAMRRYCVTVKNADGSVSSGGVVPWACEQAAFLASSVDRATIHLSYPGRTASAREFNRLAFDRRKEIDRCASEWLTRDPNAVGVVELVLQIEEEGLVSGVYVDRAADETHASCVAKVFDRADLHATLGGPVRLEASLPVYHGAEVQFDALFRGEGGDDVLRLSFDEPAWSEAADRCMLETVGPQRGAEMVMHFQVLRDGSLKNIAIIESSEEPEIDQCMLDWASQHRFIEPPLIPFAANTKIKFLQYLAAPLAVAPPEKSATPASSRHAIRVLVLRVSRSLSGSKPAKLSRGTKASIALAHEDLAAQVARLTRGALDLQTTVRDVDATATFLSKLSDSAMADPWQIEPSKLPEIERSAIGKAIEQGQWDAVFIWVPTLGEPVPYVAATLDSTTLRGATVTAIPVPGSGPVTPRRGMPAWELPLRGLWRQTLARADRLLGVDLPPDTELMPLVEAPPKVSALEGGPQELAGQEPVMLDPRTWEEHPSHSVLGWYAEALGFRVHEDLWRDAWRAPSAVPPNLAQSARASGEGILSADGLNDTLVDFGRFSNIAVADPDAREVSFGLEWRDPVAVTRVVAHIGDRSDPDRPSFRNPRLEVLGPDLKGWLPVEATREADGAIVRFTLPETLVYGVRLYITDAALSPAVREIEVY